MAHIEERIGKNGQKTYRMSVRKKGAPKIYRTFKSLQEAKTFSDLYESQVESCEYVNAPFAYVLKGYLERAKKSKFYSGECRFYRFWEEELKGLLLSEINPKIIMKALNHLKNKNTRYDRPMSGLTLRHFLHYLSAVYQWAVLEGLAKNNPAREIVLPVQKKSRLVSDEEAISSLEWKQKLVSSILGFYSKEEIKKLTGLSKESLRVFFDKDRNTSLLQMEKVISRLGLEVEFVVKLKKAE